MNVNKFIGPLALTASVSLVLLVGVSQAAPPAGEGEASSEVVVLPQNTGIHRNQMQAEVLATFSHQTEDGGGQLVQALKIATPEQLKTAHSATTMDELNAALIGADVEAPTSNVVGDIDEDFAFTPVPPCRLVDTRIAGGQLIANETREFYLYGSGSDLAGQGGVSTGCPSGTGGEPYGAMLNITTIGQVGEGTLSVYPANEAAPSVGNIVYYKTSSQIISNTAPVKAFRSIGPREIEVKNRFGQAHFVIDVLGYYYAPTIPAGIDYAGGDQRLDLSGTATVVKSLFVTMPTDGHCVINASGYFSMSGTDSTGRCKITTGTTVDTSNVITAYIGNSSSFIMPVSGTRGFSHPSGSQTYNFVCDEQGGSVQMVDSQLTAVCTANQY